MALSQQLVSQFVKATNDTPEKTKTAEVKGTTVIYEGRLYVKIDGSDRLTPVTTTTEVAENERVTVTISDHEATVTGNTSNPSAGSEGVSLIKDKIDEFGTVLAYTVSTKELEAINATIQNLKAEAAKFADVEALNADIANLEATYASLEHVTAKDVTALNASIEKIRSEFANIRDISAEELEVVNANISQLYAYNADFTYVSAQALSAYKAEIERLDANKANINFANVITANISEAWIKDLMIQGKMIVQDGTIFNLTGLHINAGDITTGTLTVDRIAVKGDDDEYYLLTPNPSYDPEVEGSSPFTSEKLDGSIIKRESISADRLIANSITADKITTNNLQGTGGWINLASGTFEYSNATTGGYIKWDGERLSMNVDSLTINSTDVATRESVESISERVDKVTGSVEVKFDEISSEINQIATGNATIIKDIDKTVKDLSEAVSGTIEQVGDYMKFDESGLTIGKQGSSTTVHISDDKVSFTDNGNEVAYINGEMLYIANEQVLDNLRFGSFAFFERKGTDYLGDGKSHNMGLKWVSK